MSTGKGNFACIAGFTGCGASPPNERDAKEPARESDTLSIELFIF